MDEYNQALCEEKHKNIEKKFQDYDTTLFGTNGTAGIHYKTKVMWDWYRKQTATQAGLLDWAFRVIISMVLAFIAVKVGLQ